MSFYSPLRYPGGKTRLSPFIKQVIKENNLLGIDYIEPYAGGAGVALSLMFEEYVSNITINDLDLAIYSFWHSVVNYPDTFCEKIDQTPITMDTWYEQKEIQGKKHSKLNLLKLGFSTFFLNRTNVSGVIKGGVVGGKNQTGKYKIDARYKKESLIKRIKRIGDYKNRINVTNEDAQNILKKNLDDCFLYIDPPYVSRGKDLYMNFYQEDDHRKISETLLNNNSNCYWVLSYDSNSLIHKLYARCKNRIPWNLNYGTSHRKGTEDIFLHSKLKFKKATTLL